MTKTPTEMMREFVKSQNFATTDEVMAAMKEMFRDVLQEVMECELSEKYCIWRHKRLSNAGHRDVETGMLFSTSFQSCSRKEYQLDLPLKLEFPVLRMLFTQDVHNIRETGKCADKVQIQNSDFTKSVI